MSDAADPPEARPSEAPAAAAAAAAAEIGLSGVRLESSDPGLGRRHRRALDLLAGSVLESPLGTPMLIEGGAYRGSWLESTATISAETLSRFAPSVARSTMELEARLARPDGLLPYKVLPRDPARAGSGGPSYRQVQMVTPLARSAWIHASLNADSAGFLGTMYGAMAANDRWLSENRDTRGRGGVEAFCAFDTGHDLSPRFWQLPDACYMEDPARFDPDRPELPYLAPDLTANAFCQRLYLARIARRLGKGEEEARSWEEKASSSLRCLMERCWDPEDRFFYDVDGLGRRVRVQSDVLLRVLACEVGDGELFAEALSRYLLNPRKFLAKFPPTSIALDDPRFHPASDRNSWAGPTNVLSILRAPAAFEARGRYVELSRILGPALAAFARMERFGQCLSPWTGEEGYTEGYTPSMLGFLDAVERLVGVLPRPGGRLWFTALPLPRLEGGRAEAEVTRYARRIDGSLFELESGPAGAAAYRDGRELFSFPRGLRVETDREGTALAAIGMVDRRVEGELRTAGASLAIRVEGNEVLDLAGGSPRSLGGPGVLRPAT